MDIGIVKETYVGETRAPLIPFAVGELVRQGNRVVIQSEAGTASGFDDQAYLDMGATIAYSTDEAFSRSELLLKVLPPSWEEYERLEDGQILFSFLALSHSTKKNLELLLNDVPRQNAVTPFNQFAIGGKRRDVSVVDVDAQRGFALAKILKRHSIIEDRTRVICFQFIRAIKRRSGVCVFFCLEVENAEVA